MLVTRRNGWSLGAARRFCYSRGSTSMRISRFWIMGAAVLLGVVLVRPAWSGIEPPVLRISAESEPLTLDWNQVRSSADRFIASFLMRGLLKYNSATHL